MLSSLEDLQKRGFLPDNYNGYLSCNSKEDFLLLLKSDVACERTYAARRLSALADYNVVNDLCKALEVEKKLYTKIEICNSLVICGSLAIYPLCCLLGKIGNNQYKNIDEKPFRKKSYPLPRDIAARTIIRFGELAIPFLVDVIKSDNKTAVYEAIDALGYICFYNINEPLSVVLTHLLQNNYADELLVWKIVRACSAFKSCENVLAELRGNVSNKYINQEIERSLLLLHNKE